NTYRKAAQITQSTDQHSLAIFYAENILGGANTVTVSDTVLGTLRFAIMEYAGIALANSLDVVATAQATGTAPDSGVVNTTLNGDLLIGAVSTADPASFVAGSGFAIQERVPASPNTKLIAEDGTQTVA